jgi:radical SAM superfamily enzyme YgiQ (UPF0313 family)
MKILFVFPNIVGYLENNYLMAEDDPGYYNGNFRLQSLSIPSVLAITPKDIEIDFVDHQIEKIPYDTNADLIAITIYTPNAMDGFQIADKFRKLGKPVVIGGKHATIMPEDTKEHADCVFVGEAECGIWTDFLKDFQIGGIKNCKPYYKQGEEYFDVSLIEPPRRDVWEKYKSKYSWLMPPLQLSKGCPIGCTMCTVPAMERTRLRIKPIKTIEKELQSIKEDYIYVVDDTILMSKFSDKYLQDLVALFKNYNKKMMLSITPSFLHMRQDMLKLLSTAADEFYYIFNCFSGKQNESKIVEEENRMFSDYDLPKRLKDYGVNLFGSMFMGYDWHDKSIFEKIVDYTIKSEFGSCEFTIATPYPGTPMWKQMVEEDRIITRDWSKYNSGNVVFKPKNMTEEELYEGFLYCWREYWKYNKSNHLIEKFGKFQDYNG